MTDTNITASTGTTVETKLTIETLTAEIKMYLNVASLSIIEVGKRLIQAKELVAHGDWQNWLNNNFNLKVRMAQNFMAVAERFGKTHSNAFLNQTQLITLLALPEGDEENFIAAKAAEGKAVDSMTVKQLRDEIKRYKAELKAKDDELSGAQIDIEARDTHIKQLNDELDDGVILIRKKNSDISDLRRQIQELKDNPVTLLPDDYEQIKAVNLSLTADNKKLADDNKRLTAENKTIDSLLADNARLKAELDQPKTTALETVEVVPDDYEQIKSENQKLHTENSALKSFHADKHLTDRLFDDVNSFNIDSGRIYALIRYLHDTDPKSLADNIDKLGKLAALLQKFQSQVIADSHSIKYITRGSVMSVVDTCDVDTVNRALDFMGYDSVQDIPENRLSDFLNKISNV